MWTGLFTHPACLGHLPPPGHPESADRLRAVLHGLENGTFQDLVRIDAPLAQEADILRAHSRAHFEAVTGRLAAAAEEEGYAHIDADTVMTPGSVEAALRAAGAVAAAVDEVQSGRLRNAFCAVRPPGHHAERDRAMGFCLFNNVAIGALRARAVHGHRRVAVVDFDVHHGNGTQAAFESDANLFYASTHQMPLYPGTGAASERGVGNIVNVPLAPRSGSHEFRHAFTTQILPALEQFRPELMLVSAGFDAHRSDPLAQLMLVEADYGWVTERLLEVAARHGRGRLVSTLEGGYDLEALAASTAAHVGRLMVA